MEKSGNNTGVASTTKKKKDVKKADRPAKKAKKPMLKGLEKYASKPNSLTELSRGFERVRFRDSKREYAALATGNGEKKVAIFHGVTGNKLDMAVLMHRLAADGFRVVAFDLPGHGEAAREEFHGFDELGGWMAGALAATGEKFDVVVSNSFASGIMYNLLSQKLIPDDMKIVMCCPTPKIAAKAFLLHLFGSLVAEDVSDDAYNSELGVLVRVESLQRKKKGHYRDWMFESEYYKMDWISSRMTINMTELFLEEKPYLAHLPVSLQRRVTVVVGKKDNCITLDAARYLRKRMPESRFVMVPEAGHLLHFEAVPEVVEVVKKVAG